MIDYDDGTAYAGKGEHYHCYGYVTIKVYVSFDCNDLDNSYDEALDEALVEIVNDEYEIENSDCLEIEVRSDEE